MVIYGFWELFSFIFLNNKYKRIGYILLVVFLFLLLVVRNPSMGLYDADYNGVYGLRFSWSQNVTLIESITKVYSFEPVFSIYVWILSRIGDYRFFLIFSAAITILIISRFIYKNTEDPVFGIVIYFSLFYFYNFYLIKQMLSLSVFIISIDFLRTRKFLPYFVLATIAFMIHRSAIVLFLLYPICLFVKFNIKYLRLFLLLIPVGILLGLFVPQTILNFINSSFYIDYSVLIRDGIYSTDGKMNFSIIMYPLLAFFCYYYNQKSAYADNQQDYIVMLVLGCILNSWSIIVVEFYRLSLYFLFPLCVLIPNTILNLEINKNKKIIKLIMLFFFYAYAFKSASNTNCLHYILM